MWASHHSEVMYGRSRDYAGRDKYLPYQIFKEEKIYLFGENKSARKYLWKRKNMISFQVSKK